MGFKQSERLDLFHNQPFLSAISQRAGHGQPLGTTEMRLRGALAHAQWAAGSGDTIFRFASSEFSGTQRAI